MRAEVEVALRRRQDEGHGDDVHLLAGGDEPAHHEQEVVEAAIACAGATN